MGTGVADTPRGARLVELSDPDDPRLADYRDLRDVELRKSLEAEHGLFLAEGEKVVRRAAAAGFAPRSFLMAPRWLDGLADVLETTDAPCFVLSEALAERMESEAVLPPAIIVVGEVVAVAHPDAFGEA